MGQKGKEVRRRRDGPCALPTTTSQYILVPGDAIYYTSARRRMNRSSCGILRDTHDRARSLDLLIRKHSAEDKKGHLFRRSMQCTHPSRLMKVGCCRVYRVVQTMNGPEMKRFVCPFPSRISRIIAAALYCYDETSCEAPLTHFPKQDAQQYT